MPVTVHHAQPLKNRFTTSDTCIILGNGPSLLRFLPELHQRTSQQHIPMFACNTFYTLESAKSLRPSFYALGDPVFETDAYIENLAAIFSDIVDAYPGISFVTSERIASHLYSKLSPYDELICRIYASKFSGFSQHGQYSFHLDSHIEPYQNVLILMLQYAIFMGFKRILLYGFDLTMSTDYHTRSAAHAVRKDVYRWKKLPVSISQEEVAFKDRLLRLQLKMLLRSPGACKSSIFFIHPL